MDGAGSSSGDVSSTATDEVPLADPELPQPNASPLTSGSTVDDDDFAVLRPNAVFFLDTRDSVGEDNNPRHNDVHADAGADDDDDDDEGDDDDDFAVLRPNAIFFLETRDGVGEDNNPRHSDVDANAAGADDDDDDDDDDDEDEDEDEFGYSFGTAPASGVAIACLPEITVAEGEAGERGECAVCLEKYVAGDVLRTMPCTHGFHERCIFGWLRASRLCPLCRFALPSEGDTNTDEDEVGTR